MKQISVIILSWNTGEFLRKCLDSLRKSGGQALQQIIVVDNASTDGSAAMIENEFPEVTLIPSDVNLGFARGNNVGLEYASGDYLALINSDIVVHPGCFETLVGFLETHKEVGLVGPKIVGANGRLQRSCRCFPKIWNTVCRSLALDSAFPQLPLFSGREMRHWNHGNQAEVEVLSGCFWLVRREAMSEVGGLDERFFFYAEDVDWCKRLRNAGWKAVFVPEATVTHFGGASSDRAPLFYSIEMIRANLRYWRKHRGVVGQTVFYLLSILHHALRFVLRKLKVMAQPDCGPETLFNSKRDLVCLRWLITGKGIEPTSSC